MDTALLEQITNAIMDALIVSVPVVDNLPSALMELPWCEKTPPEDLYVHSRLIEGDCDVFNAVTMGLTVQPDKETLNLFVRVSDHQEQFAVKHILTKEGYTRYKNESIGRNGWPMLKLFSDFAQRTQKQLSTEINERLVWLLHERVVDQIEYMLFNNLNQGKRWRNGEKTNITLRLRWREPRENANTFHRLAKPLFPEGEYSSDEYALKIFEVLTKVKQGIFETSGELCNYKRSAHRTSYQNDKKKGQCVVSPKLNNAWALFLTAGLKLRVTIWSRIEGHDGVQVMNNDDIIKDLWARDLVENPDNIQKFDQVLMCRPRDGMLRAVQRNLPNNKDWSKLSLVDRDLIPVEYQSQVEEAAKLTPSAEEEEETESIEDEQPHVLWKKPEEIQNAFEVTIGPGEIIRFLDNISGQLRFHIRDRIYFNTSTHARVAIKIADSQMQQLSIDITDFAERVTKRQYWDDASIPTGYEIMPQIRSNRVHVVWFIPRNITSHLLSFLQVNLTIYPKSMKGSFYVTHVTENRQVLLRDETYRVITLKNVTDFAIMLLELHKSDYRFLRTDPDKPKKDIAILKFKIPHPGFTGSMSDAKFQRAVSGQTNRIIEALSTFADRTNCSPTEFNTETIDSYVYKFNSNSNKHMCLTINVQDDGLYTEISLEQLSTPST
jgi:hypothetical protein